MKSRVALVLGVVGLMPMVSFCGAIFSCKHTPVTEVMSPNGRFTAQIERVGCGATTQDAFWVVLHDKRSLFQRTQRAATFDHTESVIVVWAGPEQIVIEADGGKRYGALADWHGVRIAYR